MAVSRDLDKWDRQFREPVVPRGRVGEWDGGFFTTLQGRYGWVMRSGSTTPVPTTLMGHLAFTGKREQAEQPIYTASIGLAKLKLDRFVSADGGTLTTVPLQFDGSKLELNAVTKEDGGVKVEMLDLKGNQLAASIPFSVMN